MKKVLCLTIVLCQLALLMACGGKDTASPDATAPGTTEEVLEEPEFDGADFSGKTFKYLYDTYADEGFDILVSYYDNKEILSRGTEQVKKDIQEKLGITVVYEASYEAMADALKAMEAGQCDFHGIYDYSYHSSAAALDGKLYDISDLEQVNTGAEYWIPSVAKSLTVADSMFLAVNYSTPSLVTELPAVFFNPEAVEKAGFESPYTLVREGRWTADSYIEMITSYYADLNENGEVDKGDRVGLYSSNEPLVLIKSIYNGEVYSVSKNGTYSVVGYTEDMLTRFDKYNPLVSEINHLAFNWYQGFDIGPESEYRGSAQRMMSEGTALFVEHTLSFGTFLPMDSGEFGICPVPGVNGGDWYADRERYMAVLSVPHDISDPDMVGAVLEYMAYEGMKVQLPTYYELILGEKTEATADNYEMMGEIVDRMSVDGISLYIGEDIVNRNGMLTSGHFESIWKRVQPVADAKLNEIIEKLKEAGT